MILTAAQTGLETHGPLGTLWVSIGLICFYIALIWINTLLPLFLTPLFIIPQTWLLDWIQERKKRKECRGALRRKTAYLHLTPS